VVAKATPDSAHFSFSTFSVPGAVTLIVNSINDHGTISGWFTDSAGDTKGFLRSPSGTLTILVDPGDTASPAFTELGDINVNGIVVGEFYDAASSTYSGLFYNRGNGTYRTYNLPGQPPNSATSILGINKLANHFCGIVYPPGFASNSAFVSLAGHVDIFSISGSLHTGCSALNNSDAAVGYDLDSAGLRHGWLRNSSGTITLIDEPGAATVPGSLPCGGAGGLGSVGGTNTVGINALGTISGNYWDTSYNQHGFFRTPAGKYYPVNVPGAYQTAGSGMNDHGVMVGHYLDSSCNSYGYIATPQ